VPRELLRPGDATTPTIYRSIFAVPEKQLS
jgi:hypothetical protein